jgi:predicted ester cyclase
MGRTSFSMTKSTSRFIRRGGTAALTAARTRMTGSCSQRYLSWEYDIRQGGTAMTESERELGKRWFEEVWNQGRREAIAEMMAPDSLVHDGERMTVGRSAFYSFFDRMMTTFSEMHVNVEDTIAEGDKLCVRWECTCRHTGDGLGVPPTGESVHITGISIMRLAGKMFVEAWQNWDMLGMMEQIKGVGKSGTYISAS